MIQNKLKKLLSELKKFKIQSTLVLKYKKRNDLKTIHSSVKVISSASEIYETFKSMLQSITIKIKNSASKDWVVETIVKHSITIFEV